VAEPVEGEAAAVSEVEPTQLTQVKVPISDAGDALATPDASGRFPIVVLTGGRSRIRNEFVVAGVAMLAIGFFAPLDFAVQGVLVGLGGVVLVIGAFLSFIVRVPEGAQALLLRRGRFHRILPAGSHVLPPWIGVSHVVTKREIPFVATGYAVPTSDDVRVDVQVLLTFTIDAADRFVYAISAPDFDVVCAAASQEALRRLVRSIGSDHVLDLAGTESEALRDAIGADLASYGVTVHAVVLTSIVPPAAYMASLEATRLAVVQRAEDTERHTLERRKQANRLELERDHAEGRRKLLEIDAANEAYRLEQIEARIAAYPAAAKWDFDTQRMDVARALAGNDRALLAVGDPAKLTEALLVSGRDEVVDGGQAAATAARAARATETKKATATKGQTKV
jgi:regulator of protease activity HflC (stomatin/prohibitin superfamily)